MKINKELMKGSTSILILTLLKSEDMYGYQITQELERRSDSTFEMKEGTLYPMLHALEWNVFKKAMNSIIGEECYE